MDGITSRNTQLLEAVGERTGRGGFTATGNQFIKSQILRPYSSYAPRRAYPKDPQLKLGSLPRHNQRGNGTG